MKLWVKTQEGMSQHGFAGNETLTIGRQEGNDITVNDTQVSRNHCQLFFTGGRGLKLVDLGSRNGSYVNGVRVERSFVIPGDILQIGETLIFVSDGPAPLLATEPETVQAVPRLFKKISEEESQSFESFHITYQPLTPEESTAIITFGDHNRRLQKLLSISQQISAELDFRRLLRLVLNSLVEFSGAGRGLMMLAAKDNNVRVVLGVNAEPRAITRAERKALTELAQRTRAECRIQARPKRRGPGLGDRACLCLPLIAPDRYRWDPQRDRRRNVVPTIIYGYVYLDFDNEIDLKDEDYPLLKTLLNHAATALQNAQLYHLATTEPLTSLLNRDSFFRLFRNEINRAKERERSLVVVMLDIDHFKSINDRYGHQVGDMVLREVANRLRHNTRRSDLIGRYGGEEFILCLPGGQPEEAILLAEKLRQSIGKEPIGDERLTVTASAGVSVFPKDARNIEMLVKFADKALYAAKHNGRNRSCVWSRDMSQIEDDHNDVFDMLYGDMVRDHRVLKAFFKILHILSVEGLSPETLAEIMDASLEVVSADRLSVYLGVTTTEQTMLVRRAAGSWAEKSEDDEGHRELLAQVMFDRRSYCSEQLTKQSGQFRALTSLETPSEHGKSVLCIPITAQHELFGVLYADVERSRYIFKPIDQSFLEAVSRQLALALKAQQQQQRAEHDLASSLERIRALEQDLHKARGRTDTESYGDTLPGIDPLFGNPLRYPDPDGDPNITH